MATFHPSGPSTGLGGSNVLHSLSVEGGVPGVLGVLDEFCCCCCCLGSSGGMSVLVHGEGELVVLVGGLGWW